MADQNMPTIPDFMDLDPSACAAAEAAAKSGPTGWSIPAGVVLSDPSGAKGKQHANWSEAATIEQAYRSVTKSGLLDITIVCKSRTGMPNESKKNWFHFYANMACFTGNATPEQDQKHGAMTQRTIGAIITLCKATGLFPTNGGLQASLLNMLFPPKGQLGAKSPLDGKSCVVNAHGTVEKKTATTTDPNTFDTTTTETVETQIQADTFNPES
jgi:hypothetical protein